MLRAVLLAGVLLVATPVAAQQAETLADIRQDLTVLNVEIQRLKTELSTTSGPDILAGGSLLDRVSSIEAALQDLTAKTEALEFRIARIVEDGTNRIGDLEFRLVELEGGDVTQLGETSTLGGAAAVLPGGSGSSVTSPVDPDPAAEVAVGEQADFDAAQELLASGDATGAADGFARFLDAYPGSPFEVAALIGRGDALAAQGDSREAGRSYLAAYNAAPEGPEAPRALLKLGQELEALGQRAAACNVLGQLSAAFPGASEAPEAAQSAQAMGCS